MIAVQIRLKISERKEKSCENNKVKWKELL